MYTTLHESFSWKHYKLTHILNKWPCEFHHGESEPVSPVEEMKKIIKNPVKVLSLGKNIG